MQDLLILSKFGEEFCPHDLFTFNLNILFKIISSVINILGRFTPVFLSRTVFLDAFQCLNVKELLPRSRRKIWSLSDCHWTRTHSHLVRKRTINHLANLAKWLSCVVSTYLYGAIGCMFLSCHVRVSKWIHRMTIWKKIMVGLVSGKWVLILTVQNLPMKFSSVEKKNSLPSDLFNNLPVKRVQSHRHLGLTLDS